MGGGGEGHDFCPRIASGEHAKLNLIDEDEIEVWLGAYVSNFHLVRTLYRLLNERGVYNTGSLWRASC